MCILQLFVIDVRKFQFNLKGALSGLTQFLANDSPLKMIKNAFSLT